MPNFLRLLSQKVHNVNTQSPVLPSDQSGIISPFHHTKKSQIRTILSPDPPSPLFYRPENESSWKGRGLDFFGGETEGGEGYVCRRPGNKSFPPPRPIFILRLFSPSSASFSPILQSPPPPPPPVSQFFLATFCREKKGRKIRPGEKKTRQRKGLF